MTEYRGYERRTIRTADLKVGDEMNVLGLNMLAAITKITHEYGDITKLWFLGEIAGRSRWFVVCRKTAGQSTIHVKREACPTGGEPR